MRIWMLVDIEPGYEPLVLGEEIEARCRWIDASALPADLVSRDLQFSLTPWITRDGSPSKTESIGHCGPITALLKTPNPSARSVVVSGCLEYDRYILSPVAPTVRGRIVSLGALVAYAHPDPRVFRDDSRSSEFWAFPDEHDLRKVKIPRGRVKEANCVELEVLCSKSCDGGCGFRSVAATPFGKPDH